MDRVAVSPEGNLTYQFKVEAIEVVPEEGVADMMVETLRTQMRSLEGLTGRATVTARGLVREADLKAPPGGSAQMQQSLENLRQSMRQMSAPLPEEPVGKGARWEMKISTVMEAEAAVPVPGGPPSTGAAAPTVMKMRLVMDMKVFPDEGPKSAAK